MPNEPQTSPRIGDTPAAPTTRTGSAIALDRLMEVIDQRTTIQPRERPAIRASLRGYRRAIEAEARAAARKEVADRLRVEFESRFDDQWPEWMDEAWNAAVDSLSTDTREEPRSE